MHLDQILDKIHPLPGTSKAILKASITEITFPKGHILLRADKVEPNIYFIKKGIARAFASLPDTEVTFWFGKEGDTVISMKSYVENQKGYESIELLEDCVLYELQAGNLQKLFLEDLPISNWGRRFAEQELIKTEERLISRQFRTASERYQQLLDEHPDLIQRVQLGHIASYLGITRGSLSRIRAEIR
ncbi:Crp/Fnr family transcriptional regulator [Adhaeribacter soli]|uniref:Crp/Fnr family transcriptional regulator n=1 Tax=Adhaeribacter soli TaxID=2607655 RepID=A0A5N1IX41_9BACT|nr:Crp/Fnr family transcriptional regulator [Adhaeribacter soli]KAA9338890.1 Crp/Fnr family transcriptional regulator [Adhaeribacter soli]